MSKEKGARIYFLALGDSGWGIDLLMDSLGSTPWPKECEVRTTPCPDGTQVLLGTISFVQARGGSRIELHKEGEDTILCVKRNFISKTREWMLSVLARYDPWADIL